MPERDGKEVRTTQRIWFPLLRSFLLLIHNCWKNLPKNECKHRYIINIAGGAFLSGFLKSFSSSISWCFSHPNLLPLWLGSLWDSLCIPRGPSSMPSGSRSSLKSMAGRRSGEQSFEHGRKNSLSGSAECFDSPKSDPDTPAGLRHVFFLVFSWGVS